MRHTASGIRAGSGRVAIAGLTIAALAFSLAVPAGAAALSAGPVIPINTTIAGSQWVEAITADGDGGFILTWGSWENPSEFPSFKYDLFASHFDASGTALGGEIAVDSASDESLGNSEITADDSGFIVAWQKEGRIFARRFSADDEALGAKIPVATAARSPVIAATGGGFTVAWESREQDGQADLGWGISMRRFDTAGEPLGDAIRVNRTKQGDQTDPAIIADVSGGSIVAWTNQETEESHPFVEFRRFDASGAALSDETSASPANAINQSNPSIATAGSDGFTVLWHWANDLRARRFDSSGSPLGGLIEVNPHSEASFASTSSISADPGGGFTAVWRVVEHTPGPTGDEWGIYLRRFDAAGTPFEAPVRIEQPETDPGDLETPMVTGGANRSVTVAWTRAELYEGRDTDAFARQFTSPLESLIDSGPSGPTKGGSPAFAFSSNEPGTTFECRLDDDGFTPCGSPFTAAPLPDGPHAFEVRAVDPSGETELSPSRRSFTVDTVSPQTSISSGPVGPTNDTTPTFSFSANEMGVIFQCRVDGASYSQCSAAPFTTAPLAAGPHTFDVRAIDEAGNTDASPASRIFTVDTTPPEVVIISGPTGPTDRRTPRFDFSANDDGTTFECQVDTQPPLECDSPFTTSALADGPHALLVWGTDEAGNRGLGFRTFTVDTIVPETSIDSGPVSLTKDTSPSFGFSADEPGSTFECQLDKGGFSRCSSPLTTVPLGDGPHYFEVRSTDQAGNLDQSPSARSFTVDSRAPETLIEAGPTGPTNDTTPTYSFSTNEHASFECRIDAGGFSPCISPFTSAALPVGPHSFEVRATDEAGNTDGSPAIGNFTIDTTPPFTTVYAKKMQPAGRPIEVRVTCAEDCAVVAGGKIGVRPTAGFKLRRVVKHLSDDSSPTVTLRFRTGGARNRLVQLVATGKKAVATIELTVSDRAGNSKIVTLKVHLTET